MARWIAQHAGPSWRVGQTARGLLRLIGCGALLLVFARCDDSTPQLPAPRPAAGASVERRPEPAPTPVATTARVFVDLSQSMQGFADGAELQANLEALHQAIKDSLSKANLTANEQCDLAHDGTTCGKPYEIGRLKKKDTYKATWSPIAPAIAFIPPLADSTRKSPIDEVGLSVLVTDGLQSSPPKGAAELPAACAGGADVFCLQNVLVERASQGFGIWIVTVSMPFKGWIFPEQGMAPSQFDATQAHIVEQRKLWPSTTLTVDKFQPRGATNARYQYLGPRPVVVLVLSRDLAKGREVVASLVAELVSKGRAQPAARAVDWAELTPNVPNTVRFKDVTRSNQGAKASLILPRGAATRDASDRLLASFDCREDGVAKLEIKVVGHKRPKGAPDLPASAAERFEVRAAASVPAGVIGPIKLDKPGFYSAVVGCRTLLSGQHDLEFELHYGLDLPAGRGAWEGWTSNDTYSRPERVYRLQDLVDAITARSARPDAVVDRLIVRLIRP